MNKIDLKGTKKIESPLAKYNGAGKLFCVLCNQPVKNEMFWTSHVNGRVHRDNLQVLKSKKRPQQSNSHESDDMPPPKKPAIASIFDKKTSSSNVIQGSSDSKFKMPFPVASAKVTSLSPNPPLTKRSIEEELVEVKTESLEQRVAPSRADEDEEDQSNGMEVEESTSNGSGLPEGFFDDPKLDAKARGLEYRNPEEIEWENFVKEIASEELKSSTMRVVDEEESTISRELDEIEDQMTHWQRVLDLERKAEEAKKKKSIQGQLSTSVDSDEDDEVAYDEELDWRSKKH